MNKRSRSLILSALAVLSVAGCGSTPRAHLGAIPFQAAILADGKVTFAEYRMSTLAMVHCLRTARVRIVVTTPVAAPGGELEFRWWVAPGGGNAQRRDALARVIFEQCHRRFEDRVKLVYNNQRVIPLARRPAVRDRLVACLRRSGLRVPDRPAMPELIAVLDADRQGVGLPCADRYADFFRVFAPLDAN